MPGDPIRLGGGRLRGRREGAAGADRHRPPGAVGLPAAAPAGLRDLAAPYSGAGALASVTAGHAVAGRQRIGRCTFSRLLAPGAVSAIHGPSPDGSTIPSSSHS